ncbi:hypothetical protein ARZXY2_421 [Arthrobacter sp. ZXY-2]|nr:hypothetical protein ARZXY2_421 [Arthrobacter sp. ZXY-2]
MAVISLTLFLKRYNSPNRRSGQAFSKKGGFQVSGRTMPRISLSAPQNRRRSPLAFT